MVRLLRRFVHQDFFPLLRHGESTYAMTTFVMALVGVVAARLGLGPAGIANAVLSSAFVLAVTAGVRLRSQVDRLEAEGALATSADAAERERLQGVLREIESEWPFSPEQRRRDPYFLSRDLKPPVDWLNSELARRGERWRIPREDQP